MALIDITDFRGDPRVNRSRRRDPYWHFTDTRYERQQDFTLSNTFPHAVYLHIDDIDGKRYGEPSEQDAADFRIAIRRWIEANIVGDVIYERVSMAYTRVYPIDPKRDKGRDRLNAEYTHGYYVFHFENTADAFGFRLQFPQVVTKTLPYRPDHPPGPDDVDFTDRWKADRFIRGY